VNHFQDGFKTLSVFLSWLCLLFSSACSSEFFVDKGHRDVIGGVEFEITAPYLFEKKAFKLRGENLSTWQLQHIADAMPMIAAMTNSVLANDTRPTAALQRDPKVRSIRQLQRLDQATFLAVKTLQNWQVTEGQIQFTTDYFYMGAEGHFVYFRDNYVFRKRQQQWVFERHAKAQPEGLLRCEKNNRGWRQCEPDKDAVLSAPVSLSVAHAKHRGQTAIVNRQSPPQCDRPFGADCF
jgi:hypothetical protein